MVSAPPARECLQLRLIPEQFPAPECSVAAVAVLRFGENPDHLRGRQFVRNLHEVEVSPPVRISAENGEHDKWHRQSVGGWSPRGVDVKRYKARGIYSPSRSSWTSRLQHLGEWCRASDLKRGARCFAEFWRGYSKCL